eukprot:768642-Hanusia_phi.AAC.2
MQAELEEDLTIDHYKRELYEKPAPMFRTKEEEARHWEEQNREIAMLDDHIARYEKWKEKKRQRDEWNKVYINKDEHGEWAITADHYDNEENAPEFSGSLCDSEFASTTKSMEETLMRETQRVDMVRRDWSGRAADASCKVDEFEPKYEMISDSEERELTRKAWARQRARYRIDRWKQRRERWASGGWDDDGDDDDDDDDDDDGDDDDDDDGDDDDDDDDDDGDADADADADDGHVRKGEQDDKGGGDERDYDRNERHALCILESEAGRQVTRLGEESFLAPDQDDLMLFDRVGIPVEGPYPVRYSNATQRQIKYWLSARSGNITAMIQYLEAGTEFTCITCMPLIGLLSKGEDIDYPDQYGNTALHMASARGHTLVRRKKGKEEASARESRGGRGSESRRRR